MASDNDKSKKGFSGLSDLTSDVSGINESIKPVPKAEKPSAPEHPPLSQWGPISSSEPERKTTTTPPPIGGIGGGKRAGGSGGKWILVIIAVWFVILLVNSGEQETKPPAYSPPSPAQSSSSQQAKPTPTTTPKHGQSDGLQHEKPPIGTNNLLSTSQIRWCIREGIRIETMRDTIETNPGIDEFNSIVNDYNIRCVSYRYRQGSQQQAEREVEIIRSQIVAGAIQDARQLDRSSRATISSVSPNISTSSAPERPNAQYTREAQQLLTELGYTPGPVDGLYGSRTADAVKTFQRDAGLAQTGQIDPLLMGLLRMYRQHEATPR